MLIIGGCVGVLIFAAQCAPLLTYPPPPYIWGERYGKRVLQPIGPYQKIVQEVRAEIAEKAEN